MASHNIWRSETYNKVRNLGAIREWVNFIYVSTVFLVAIINFHPYQFESVNKADDFTYSLFVSNYEWSWWWFVCEDLLFWYFNLTFSLQKIDSGARLLKWLEWRCGLTQDMTNMSQQDFRVLFVKEWFKSEHLILEPLRPVQLPMWRFESKKASSKLLLLTSFHQNIEESLPTCS